MINRVLIRVKVVQMLYSFMLSQSEFHLMPEPDAEASRDKKFAYGVYSRMLWLIFDFRNRHRHEFHIQHCGGEKPPGEHSAAYAWF